MAGNKSLATLELENRIDTTVANHNDSKAAELPLEASTNQINKDMTLVMGTSFPIIMSGIFVPMAVAPEMYLTGLSYISTFTSLALATIPMIGFNSGLRPVRMIRHQFKNTTGEKLPLRSARSIRLIQKTLIPTNPVSIKPAQYFLDESPILKMAEEKGLELSFIIRTDSVGLHIVKPPNADVLWDNAVESLSEIYQLEQDLPYSNLYGIVEHIRTTTKRSKK